MPVAWRLVRSRHSASAFNGEGARLYGGRWNSPGSSVVYTSAHLSLAALETLVHVLPLTPRDLFTVFRATWEDKYTETISVETLARSWQCEPPGDGTTRLGDSWVREKRSAVLAVPSTILPEESNFLFNPRHPDFPRMTIQKVREFHFDSRLAL